ncbi:MAG: sensor histidine kinase, partial [Flavobacteriales bacterium]
IRRISHDLRPGVLDDLGLTAALEALTDSFAERTGVAVELKSVAFKNMILPEARTALYRVAQEALTNIERHANATRVRVIITSAGHGPQMLIEDDGQGFIPPPAGRSSRGLGLRNMQERMEHFGGSLEVRTTSKGTTLKVELDGGRIILRKNVDDALAKLRGRFKLDGFADTDEAMRAIRGHAPGDPYLPPESEPEGDKP